MDAQKRPIILQDEAKKAQIALKAFFNMADLWKLNNHQQMIFRWKKGEVKELSLDTQERISYLLGIYKALHILFTNPEQANTWLYRDNQASVFAGRSALDYMLQGKMVNLYEVRKYLDAQRG